MEYFREKINKKSSEFFAEELIKSDLHAFVCYFKLQNRYLEIRSSSFGWLCRSRLTREGERALEIRELSLQKKKKKKESKARLANLARHPTPS